MKNTRLTKLINYLVDFCLLNLVYILGGTCNPFSYIVELGYCKGADYNT